MTEVEWLACTNPTPLQEFVWGFPRPGERKVRLLGVALCRSIWHLLVDARSRNAVEVAERYADGSATREELDEAYDAAFEVSATLAERQAGRRDACASAAWAASTTSHPQYTGPAGWADACEAAGSEDELAIQAGLTRCVFGGLFHRLRVDPVWLAAAVTSLAQGIYDGRSFDRLPILADALQDAGCEARSVLAHCRSGGPHARGCWVTDLLLGKE